MNSRVMTIVLPLVAIVLYLAIDIGYVFLAKNVYERAVINIQRGEKMQADMGAAVVCYIIMAIGWFFIVVQLAQSIYARIMQRTPSWTPVAASGLAGLTAGLLYGFVVYGVYNLTTRALFSDRYPVSVVIQDILWGSLFNAIFTAVYMMISRKLTNPADL